MKKLSIVLALVLITGGAFAQKACCKKGGEHSGKACCKKEAGKSEAKAGEETHDMTMASSGKACCKKGSEHGKVCCKKADHSKMKATPMRDGNAPVERMQEAPAQR